MKRQYSVRELAGEIHDELEAAMRDAERHQDHPFAGFDWTMKGRVIDLVMGVLARHDGELIINDPDMPVEPLPHREDRWARIVSEQPQDTTNDILFIWLDRLDSDERLEGIGTDIRDGEAWLYANCKSAEAAELLLHSLWEAGWRQVAHRSPVSLWLEQYID